MYLEDCASIKKTSDGKYVLSVQPPPAKQGKGDSPNAMANPKTYIANDIDELTLLIDEHIGGKKSSDKSEYEKGFTGK